MFSRDFLKIPVTGPQFMKRLCINLSPPLFKIYKKKPKVTICQNLENEQLARWTKLTEN